jgi:ribonuclease P protein component
LRVSVPDSNLPAGRQVSLHLVPRFSILLSKKTARLAVDRNLIRRRTSALLAELIPSPARQTATLSAGFPPADYLVIPKHSVIDTPHSDLLSDLSTLFPKLT